MAGNEPFDQLAGLTLDVYLAPVGEAVPEPNVAPVGNWVKVGPTDGEQSVEHRGALTYHRDNDHQGPVKATRAEEEVVYAFMVVGLTLEHYARLLDRVSDVVTAGAKKKLPLKMGRIPNEYALLFRSNVLSPYGAFAGQYVVPRGVFDGERKPTFARDGRAGLSVEFHALEDDDQPEADRLGWLEVMTA